MRTIPLFLILPAMPPLSGCYYNNEEELYPNSFCDTTNVTFNATIVPLVQSRCAIPDCHVTGYQTPYLSQAAEVLAIANNGDLRTFVVVNKTMPPAGALPTCDRTKIQSWLNAGAPEN